MMPFGGRALLALLALSRAVEMAGRNTAGNLDLAFWQADSREFEGEAARLAWARPVWGPLIVEESADEAASGLIGEHLGRVRSRGMQRERGVLPRLKRHHAEITALVRKVELHGELSRWPGGPQVVAAAVRLEPVDHELTEGIRSRPTDLTTVLRENDLEREASPWVFTLSLGEGADQRSHRVASERTPEASRYGRLSR